MTTDGVFQFAPDINVNNDVYVLDKKSTNKLSAVAFVDLNWKEKVEATKKAIDILGSRLQQTFPRNSHWLFIGHRNWQADTKIVRHKKLWAYLLARDLKIPDGEKINEVMVSSEHGIKYVGLIKCTSISEVALASVLRSGLETQLIFAREDVAMGVSEILLPSGWEHKAHAPAEKVVDLLCDKDIFGYLPLGWFDDRESGCAVIAKPELICLPFPEYC